MKTELDNHNALRYIIGQKELWKSYLMYTEFPESFFDYRGEAEKELK